MWWRPCKKWLRLTNDERGGHTASTGGEHPLAPQSSARCGGPTDVGAGYAPLATGATAGQNCGGHDNGTTGR